MTKQQKEELLTLVEETRYPEVFEKLNNLGINTPEVHQLRAEFISGVNSVFYNQRLQIFITTYKSSRSKSILSRSREKQQYYILLIGLCVLLIGFIILGYLYNLLNYKNENLELTNCKALLSFLKKNSVVIQMVEKMHTEKIEVEEIEFLENPELMNHPFLKQHVEIYLEECLNDGGAFFTYLTKNKGKTSRLFKISLNTLDHNYKSFLITVYEQSNEIEYYFELDSNNKVIDHNINPSDKSKSSP